MNTVTHVPERLLPMWPVYTPLQGEGVFYVEEQGSLQSLSSIDCEALH